LRKLNARATRPLYVGCPPSSNRERRSRTLSPSRPFSTSCTIFVRVLN